MRPDLYEITGLPRDVGPERLRYVYEQHVDAAARSQDHHRLLELSRAFDGLSRPTRLAMYPRTSTARTPGTGAASKAPSPVRAKRQRHRRERPQPACSQNPWRQRITGKQVLGFLAVVGVLAGAQFIRAHQHAANTGSNAMPNVVPQAAAVVPQINATAVQLDLERINGRADITCSPAGMTTSTQLTCQASDGATWAVTVYAPPDRYTAKLTSYSVYHQSARVDAMDAADAVRECRRYSGELPPPVSNQVGQVQMFCGQGISTLYLRPGDRLDYQRVNSRTFVITVTAMNGETVTFSSATGKTTPAG